MSSRLVSRAAGVLGWTVMCGAVLGAMQDVSLQYRWTKGEALRYRIAQVSATTISGLPGGMPDMTIDQSTTQVFRTVAEEIAADGTTTLRQVVESIKMDMSSPMFTTSFDSASPDGAAANNERHAQAWRHLERSGQRQQPRIGHARHDRIVDPEDC